MAYHEGVRLAEPPATGTAETADDLLERQRLRESSARSYPRRLPIALVSATGSTVRDRQGREYIDCLAGAGALALGHHHPVVVQALHDVLDEGAPLSTLDLPTPVRDRFVEQLFAVLPEPLRDGRILFCGPTGADAVEAAVKLARTATGRSGLVAFGGAYHGMTQGTLALSGRKAVKEPLGTLLPDVHHLPFPTAFRSPFGLDDGAAMAGRLVEWALTDDLSGIATPAAVIAEPVQGEGGVQPMPAAFAATVRRATRAAGTVLIADEVQTGLGRTGDLWAGEAIGLDPDVLVLSKAIGGGLPLAVIVHRGELDGWQPGSHAGTFRGQTLALAAGAATIREVVRAGLAERAREAGRRLTEGLLAVAADDPRVGHVRGRGLMVGAELVDPGVVDADGVPVPDGWLAGRVQRAMLERGVIVEVGGSHDAVVRFLPPLVISDDELDRVVDAFGAALRAVHAEADEGGER
ncbi:diaminobutyrate--2-oxoglutarate transaminase family protein [Jiangella alkaliphila]|uniref:Diaminobutyrate--2-oxoglutarate transaminase n=1 Tax=Jiangella alkaliphila TaxID=419479 RepID=A0A1H2G9J9_9ACTN|nr:diaminobutyrate--2-oxoglutarate transaminase family protein [Jiangella alkaliphila]SDU16151.1 diaminobutyrate aminotransferase apoenzyme [Jiangella alkaliphila]